MKTKNKLYAILILSVFQLITSCTKFLDIDPPKDRISPGQVFENNEIATSAVTGIYARMASAGFASGDRGSLSVLFGLSSGELKSHNAALSSFYQGELSSSATEISTVWTGAYTCIYGANAVLEGLQNASGVSPATKAQLQGEARFIRAFCYFYLTSAFGQVPLNLSTDYRINEKAGKASLSVIYQQIQADLGEAETLLSPAYITTERIRPNKWAATALLSRVLLYLGQWEMAAQKASEVISQSALYTLPQDLDQVFLKNSGEAVWQLQPTMSGSNGNTKEGNLFILAATPLYVSLPEQFPGEFDSGDLRKSKWIKEYSNATGKYYYPYKYKIRTAAEVTEYSMVIRLAELHLIRAEARARQENPEQSLADINLIRKRAGLGVLLSGLSLQQCLTEIEKQRKLELFCEWGHRWLDLKRTGRAGAVLSPLKGSTWQDTDLLYPIPDTELSRNPGITQNDGYQP